MVPTPVLDSKTTKALVQIVMAIPTWQRCRSNPWSVADLPIVTMRQIGAWGRQLEFYGNHKDDSVFFMVTDMKPVTLGVCFYPQQRVNDRGLLRWWRHREGAEYWKPLPKDAQHHLYRSKWRIQALGLNMAYERLTMATNGTIPIQTMLDHVLNWSFHERLQWYAHASGLSWRRRSCIGQT